MNSLAILILPIMVVNISAKANIGKPTLIEDLKLQCDSLCTTYDGVFEFNEKQKACICYVGKFFDDMEVELMRKNAKSMGMTLKTIKSIPEIRSKRDTLEKEPALIAPTTEATKKKFFFPEKKPSIFKTAKEQQPTNNKFQFKSTIFPKTDSPVQDSDGIVGSAINLNTRANLRPPGQNQLLPLQPGATKDVWLKARQRLDHLIKHSDGGKFNSRFAASETQAIRNALKPLTLKAKNGGKPLSTQGRSKGFMGNTKHGGGLNRNSQGLKISGKSNLTPLSKGPLNKHGSLFKQTSLVKPRMNPHGMVSATGPLEVAPNDAPLTSTSTTTEQGALMIEKTDKKSDIGGKIDKHNFSKQESKRRGGEVKQVREGKASNIVVQPTYTFGKEEQDSEE